MIHVRELSKMYKIPKEKYKKSLKNFFWPPQVEKVGVDQISFDISEGEIVGFVGPNGAGKTTTIKMLCGILTPTSGEVKVCGYIPTKSRHKYSKNIGVLMGQKSILFYDIPVIESFKFYKDVYNLTTVEFENSLHHLVEKLDLKSLLNIPVRKMSLGQRMRCEVVASLLHQPKIVFLDEPTIGLDIIAKQKILDFLHELNTTQNTTIFLTTHDLSDIDRLCQRIIILDKGHIHYDGNIHNLHSRDQYKIIEISHTEKFRPGTINSNAECITASSRKTRLKVSREEISNLLDSLNSNPEVFDLNINLISLEEIIREIYESKNLDLKSKVGEL